MSDLVIKFDNVSKQYRLGAIGRTTFREEVQRLGARIRHEEDPTAKIGQVYPKGVLAEGGDSFWALRNIDLEVHRGERLGIIGRNGAGKSTLLKLLCRITAPTEGTISYNGRIASMLEVGTGFHPELTGRENIYLNGAILGMSQKETGSKIDRIISFSECGPFIDTPVKRYSSGMYVKLAFSVAAFLDADIMIMDEVLAVGDAAFQKKCLQRMRELADEEQRTILYVSHILPTVSELCDRCIVLDQGRISYEGDAEDAIGHYLEHEIAAAPVIDYSKERRKNRPGRYAIRLMRAAFEGKDSTVFYDEEPVLLRLNYAYLEDFQDISLRWELRTADGRAVATSALERFDSGHAGEERSVLLKFRFPELMEGRYESVFTFYNRLPGGTSVNLEHAAGLSFEKKQLRLENLGWNAAKWGSIRLPVPEVEEIS